ncbi:MAG: Gfo/Idh/MocA family oxidoreductase [Verrucomicrobia bacterium]|nr:Gfo/Idh/MocA family oxidoreductase [Verrucomicrobiota bacterium]
MQPPVSIGVVGLGFGQQVHVPAFRADPRCEVRALCASSLERAQKAATAQNISKASGDWRELLADPAIHAVSLAVPPSAQAEIALAAARAGKHLFCEKPLALNVAQALEILAAAQQSKVAHAMDFIFPEIPAWQKAREFLPQVGRIRHVALTWRVETYAYRAKLQNWKTAAASGGGTLNNFASHTFYYLEWLFGPVTRLAAKLMPRPPEADARLEAWLEFAPGFSATVSIAADAFLGPGHCLEVYGDDGALRLDNKTADYARGFVLSLGTRQGGKLETVAVPGDAEVRDGRIEAVARIASRFVDAILSGQPATPNLRDGLRVQQLIDAARLSGATGAWQNLPVA